MANILLICNINCDHLIELSSPLSPGGRVDGRSAGRRIGGAGANAGSALAIAGHRVSIACELGDDDTGDWLCDQARELGLSIETVERRTGPTPEVLLLREPDGERSIVFIDRREPWAPPPTLLTRSYDGVFINSPSPEAAQLAEAALAQSACRVVAQMPQRPIAHWPAEVLVGSASDVSEAWLADPFGIGQAMAGERLQWVVMTRGAEGASAYSATECIDVPAVPVARVVDATGAGDVFAAGLLDALLDGQPMRQALWAAAQWGACAVQSASTTAIEPLRDWLSASDRADRA